MNGGEYLGSGTYGCIFYPAIRCKDGKQSEGVGKIFSDDDDRKWSPTSESRFEQ